MRDKELPQATTPGNYRLKRGGVKTGAVPEAGSVNWQRQRSGGAEGQRSGGAEETRGNQAAQTPAMTVPQYPHFPFFSRRLRIAKISRSMMARLQFGQKVVSASSTSLTLPM